MTKTPKVSFLNYSSFICVCACVCVCHGIHKEDRKRFVWVASLLLLCGYQGSIFGCQACSTCWTIPLFHKTFFKTIMLITWQCCPISHHIGFLLQPMGSRFRDLQLTISETQGTAWKMERKDSMSDKGWEH